ncbi:hypothetical protein BHE74_00048882, partial [Ensete ventricosum]
LTFLFPLLNIQVGGVETVTLGDDEARARRSQKSILERKAPPTFPFLIEMRERNYWVTHRTERSVDMLLIGKKPLVEKSCNECGVLFLQDQHTSTTALKNVYFADKEGRWSVQGCRGAMENIRRRWDIVCFLCFSSTPLLCSHSMSRL